MIERSITLDGRTWTASITGGATAYDRDEFSLVFAGRDGHGRRERRVSRFSPLGTRTRAKALAELSDADLERFFRQSQPEWTSPELHYAR